MYICNNGHVFDTPRPYAEQLGEYWGTPAYYYTEVCPVCGDQFDEALHCARCDELHMDCELDSNGLCEECAAEFVDEAEKEGYREQEEELQRTIHEELD